MKKALSVLLILAAAFGFYGGAASLNDVLDCKAYWEEEGRKTTENLNKLEDGLDELGENTEAYLDGLKQVAQGEIDLANGEKDLAAGRAELAKGEADYKAAPAKLAAGEKQVKEGEASLASLDQLIGGINQVNTGFNGPSTKDQTAFKDGLAGLDAGRTKIAGLVTEAASSGTLDVEKIAKLTGLEVKDIQATMGVLMSAENTYKDYNDAVQAAVDMFGKAGQALSGYEDSAKGISGLLGGLSDMIGKGADDTVIEKLNTAASGASDLVLNFADEDSSGTPAEKAAAIKSGIEGIATYVGYGTNVVDGEHTGYELAVGTAAEVAKQFQPVVDGIASAKAIMNGYASQMGEFNGGYAQLAAGQTQLAGGVAQCLGGMLGNKDMASAAKALAAAYGIPWEDVLSYATTGSPLFTDDFDTFAMHMGNITGVAESQVLPLLNKTKTDGIAALNEGKKTLAAGIADYKAAPAKLQAGRKALADGIAKLEDGKQTLADGKAKLAEYEDGEQQIRDGLKTLMETEANGGLTSIADRIGADEDFSLEDGNLDFDAGYKGVKTGREYSADSSVLITKELTQRGIGTGLGIGAGVAAILAAILGFLKKNKGAGVLGLIAAAAAAAGAFVTKSAGIEFSAIAGSALGSTPIIAVGVLAVLAIVHAIAHFTAPKVAE